MDTAMVAGEAHSRMGKAAPASMGSAETPGPGDDGLAMPDRAGPVRRQDAEPCASDRNEVVLTGRLSVAPEVRVLPSGRELTTFRVVVRRPDSAAANARPGGRKQKVDVIECAVWHRRLADRLDNLRPGDALVVRGALRRRFARGERGLTSWVNVEVADIDPITTGTEEP